MQTMQAIYVKKNIPGSYILSLNDFFGIKPVKLFVFKGEERVIIPYDYALSIYNEPELKKQLEEGVFGIIPPTKYDIFKEYMKEHLYEEDFDLKEPDVFTKEQEVSNIVKDENGEEKIEITINHITPEQILNLLKEGNKNIIKEMLETEGVKHRVITVANDNYTLLTREIVELIEDITQIGIGLV